MVYLLGGTGPPYSPSVLTVEACYQAANAVSRLDRSDQDARCVCDTARTTEEVREKVLWEAHFSQAGSDAERRSMARAAEQKYALAILDPDFFARR